MSLSSEEFLGSVAMSLSSDKLPKSVAMSISSEKSFPLTLTDDGKVRIRSGKRVSLDLSNHFSGKASVDSRPHSSLNQQRHRSTDTVSQQSDGDDHSLGNNSSVTLSGSLIDGLNETIGSNSTFGNGINGRIAGNALPGDSGSSPGQYADGLRRHLNGGSSRISESHTSSSLPRRKLDQSGLLRQILEKLREELDSYRNFVDEFVLPPVNGLTLLIDLLREIQTERREYRGSRTAKYAHATLEESVCIACIGKIIMHREHLLRFLDDQEATQAISESSMTEDIDINIAAIQVLSMICDSPKGHTRVIKAVSRSNSRLGQIGRLTGIVALLTSASDHDQKATVVRFFNDLWNSAPSLGAKIFLQFELQFANFRPDHMYEYHSSSGGADDLLQELETWRRNCIDEPSLRRKSMSTEVGRNTASLTNELEQLKEILKESNRKIDNLESERKNLDEKCDSYLQKIQDLQDKVRQLRGLYEDQTGRDAEEDLRIESTQSDNRLRNYATVDRNFAMQTQLRMASMGTMRSDVSTPRPIDPSMMRQSMRLKMAAHIQLPLLHWTPMHAIGSTIFEDMDVEAVLRAMNFSELESTFQLPSKLESLESRNRREKSVQRIAKKITFVENNRAKNLIITQRKTGLNALELKLSIDACDVSALPGEFAHLLLNYIPTKEELQQLNVHENSYDDLGEAERVLYQMIRVERLNTKLAVMVFLGAFEETISNTKPNIEMLRKASDSVLDSDRLKAVFEIILVYGNYLNCAKRGYAPGFRLDTLAKLSDVKSQDKSVTLLHLLVSVFERNFPALATFYEDLDLDGIKSVSYQGIVESIMMLRKGVELVSEELQYQPNNDAISSFYSSACEQVSALYEPFREMVNAYRAVCCLFGENHRIIEPAELFGHLIDFTSAFKKASVENFNRLNPPISSRSSDSDRKASKGVALTTATAATATDKRMSFRDARSKLRKVSTTTGPAHLNDVVDASSTSSDVSRKDTSSTSSDISRKDVSPASSDVSRKDASSGSSDVSRKDASSASSDKSSKDDRQTTSHDVIVTSETGLSKIEAKSSTPSVSERASTGFESGTDRSRLSTVKVGSSSTSVYYPASSVKAGQRSSKSKKPPTAVPNARRDLPPIPVIHEKISVNHIQSTRKDYAQPREKETGFRESSIYESIADY